MEKSVLRQQLRAARAALPLFKRQHYAYRLSLQLENLALFSRGKRLAFYLANDGEIDPAFAIKRARKYSCEIFLPCIKNNILEFKKCALFGKQKLNRFGIAEPVGNSISAQQLDAIFLPLVGFDSAGQRIGMGGGFYDRSLEKLLTRSLRPLLIGLAYDLQEVERVPTDSWDLPLDAIATESRLIWV